MYRLDIFPIILNLWPFSNMLFLLIAYESFISSFTLVSFLLDLEYSIDNSLLCWSNEMLSSPGGISIWVCYYWPFWFFCFLNCGLSSTMMLPGWLSILFHNCVIILAYMYDKLTFLCKLLVLVTCIIMCLHRVFLMWALERDIFVLCWQPHQCSHLWLASSCIWI